MTNLTKGSYARRLIFRLSEHQYQHVKSMDNPSDYLRCLIECDRVVGDDKA